MMKHILKILTLIIIHSNIYAMEWIQPDDEDSFDFIVNSDKLFQLEDTSNGLQDFLRENPAYWIRSTSEVQLLSEKEIASAWISEKTKIQHLYPPSWNFYKVEISFMPEKSAHIQPDEKIEVIPEKSATTPE